MNFTKFVIILQLISNTIQDEVNVKLLESFVNEFKVKHPSVINNDKRKNIDLTKLLFKKGHYCRSDSTSQFDDVRKSTSDLLIDNYRNISAISQLIELQKSTDTVSIFANEKDLKSIQKSLKVSIDKKVFLVNKSSKEVFEIYQIGNHHIHKKLGKFNDFTHDFVWSKGIERDYIKRRSNFHGVELKAMTETTGTMIKLDSGYIANARYFSENETYLVNKYVMGSFHDILLELQFQLNFTTKIFKRKKRAWGYVYPQPNGSYVATGMVGDLFFNRADLVVASLTINPERGKYIDYLLPLEPQKIGLYIPMESSKGDFDYDIYFSPFR